MQNIRDEGFITLLRQHLHVDVARFCFSPVEVAGVLDRIRNLLLEKINQIDYNNEIQGSSKSINLIENTSNTSSKTTVTQTHSGTGDNVGGSQINIGRQIIMGPNSTYNETNTKD